MTNWYLPAAAVDDDDLANDDVVLDWNYIQYYWYFIYTMSTLW